MGVNSLSSSRSTASRKLALLARAAWSLGLTLFLACSSAPEAPHEEILAGSDSAGARIELRLESGEFVSARVIDAVLGTAEADIEAVSPQQIEFTMRFPAGATIIYEAEVPAVPDASADGVNGRWTQVQQGSFAGDSGTWEAGPS